jgi:hypothetical protein
MRSCPVPPTPPSQRLPAAASRPDPPYRKPALEVCLEDALAICVAYRDEPELYERAAMRWLGRFCLEARGATLEDVYQVAEALERLPDHHGQVAAEPAKLIARR